MALVDENPCVSAHLIEFSSKMNWVKNIPNRMEKVNEMLFCHRFSDNRKSKWDGCRVDLNALLVKRMNGNYAANFNHLNFCIFLPKEHFHCSN